MESIKKLEEIKAITGKGFFKEHLDIFWGYFQQWNNSPEKKWDGRDYFYYVMQYNSYSEEVKYSLGAGLKTDIEKRFSHLEKAFLTDIVNLDEDSQQNLIEIVRQKISSIHSGSNDLILPFNYHKVIHNHFKDCAKGLNSLMDEYNYPRISKNGFYYRRLYSRDGQRAFKKFYKEMISSRFISGCVTEDELRDLFSHKKLTKKIIWGGSPKEAQFFFTTLDTKDFIETKSLWITVGEHFLIRKKGGDYFHPDNLRGLPKFKEDLTKERNKMTEIKSLIEILNV